MKQDVLPLVGRVRFGLHVNVSAQKIWLLCSVILRGFIAIISWYSSCLDLRRFRFSLLYVMIYTCKGICWHDSSFPIIQISQLVSCLSLSDLRRLCVRSFSTSVEISKWIMIIWMYGEDKQLSFASHERLISCDIACHFNSKKSSNVM